MSEEKTVIFGWDIGGAHLKLAIKETCLTHVQQYVCPIWQGMDKLEKILQHITQEFPVVQQAQHHITMTAELADIFPDRETGIQQIHECISRYLPIENIYYFTGDALIQGALINPQHYQAIASANWLATTCHISQYHAEGLVIDVGSTTTDIIPFFAGEPAHRGYTDQERLYTGELVYTGITRTALMSLTDKAPWAGQWLPLMAEHFATTADIYRLTEQLPSDVDLHPAADNGEKTLLGSARRLARLLANDIYGEDEVPAYQQLAHYFIRQQKYKLHAALELHYAYHRIQANTPFIGVGIGRFLVQQLAQEFKQPYYDSSELFEATSQTISDRAVMCAPAAALTYLSYLIE